jgi:hypothetical protein
VASGFVLHMFLVPVNNTVYLKDLAAVAWYTIIVILQLKSVLH